MSVVWRQYEYENCFRSKTITSGPSLMVVQSSTQIFPYDYAVKGHACTLYYMKLCWTSCPNKHLNWFPLFGAAIKMQASSVSCERRLRHSASEGCVSAMRNNEIEFLFDLIYSGCSWCKLSLQFSQYYLSYFYKIHQSCHEIKSYRLSKIQVKGLVSH